MSTDSESPKAKAAKPIRRLGTGLLLIVQILCVVVLFVALNYLSAQHHIPKDLSGEASYTLSPSTRRYLESAAIRDREEPIRMLVAFRRVNPMYEKVRVLAEEYMRLSNGKVRLELLDPVRSPDRAQQVVDQFGSVYTEAYKKTIFNTDLIIVDARSKAEKEQAAAAGASSGANPHIRFIEAERMARFETDQKGQRKMTGFQGEDAMTTGVVAAVEGKPRKVYLLVDKSGYSTEDGANTPLASFENILLTQNALTLGARIAELDRIPDDAAAVAILNPAYDFSAAELAVLEEYWQRANSGILVTLGSSETPPHLRAFLRNQGITPGKDRVITKKGEQVISTARGNFTQGMDFTQDFAGKAMLLEGPTSSLEIRENNNEDLINKKIFPTSLLKTPPEFWGETKFATPNPVFDPSEDNRGPMIQDRETRRSEYTGLSLAGAVIRGAGGRDDTANQISRMVVISNSDFLAPKHLTDINRNFVASSVNWLMGREELTGEGPLTLGTYKLPLLDSQLSFINRVNLFFLPAFALIIGAIVWSSRRA
ncbi:GldG family protein [Luteolibacter sp. GHJ8]|uniref:GldG family protein n=1 Tax=Luteolibacter rhizosphaerae TaxID=2989719 RepID=A0ABT3G2K4_9BACT|nr:GldG family protein [Luteolibacter rhizosphaerae]MCW1913892.1 GldG family protein [Luteolibacter rhizosphaerae]